MLEEKDPGHAELDALKNLLEKADTCILDFSHFQFVPIPAGIGITLTP